MKKKMMMTALLLSAGCSSQPQQLTEHPRAAILFDTSHGETAGEADWVIDGAFSSYADDLKKHGFKVSETKVDARITDEMLNACDVFVLPEPNIPLKTSEQQALKTYVEAGGSVLMISDHYNADRNMNRFDASEVLNGYRRGAYHDPAAGMSPAERQSEMLEDVASSDFLSDTFGVRFRYNAVDHVTLTKMDDAFGITNGVRQVNMHAGATIAITNPEIAKGIVYLPYLDNNNRWSHAVDQGIYNGGGMDEGPFVAVSKVGKGKAAFIGDSSMIEDDTPKYKREDNGREKQTYDGYNEADHARLMMNISSWLSQKEDFSHLKEKVTMDHKTPTLKMEEPSLSTEPVKEPWTQPEQGYLWYDRSTYAAGSYGSLSMDTEKKDRQINRGKIVIDAPDQVNAGQSIHVEVAMDTEREVKIEIVKGHQQLGLFNGRPPGPSNAYTTRKNGSHYSCYFNGRIAREAGGQLTIHVIINNKTVASKTINVR